MSIAPVAYVAFWRRVFDSLIILAGTDFGQTAIRREGSPPLDIWRPRESRLCGHACGRAALSSKTRQCGAQPPEGSSDREVEDARPVEREDLLDADDRWPEDDSLEEGKVVFNQQAVGMRR